MPIRSEESIIANLDVINKQESSNHTPYTCNTARYTHDNRVKTNTLEQNVETKT